MLVSRRRNDSDRDTGPLTVAEAARRLGDSARRVRKLLRAGDLRGWKENGRWRVPRAAVEQERERREHERWEGAHEHRVGRERSRYRR